MKRKDGLVDELLARGTLGGPAYDEICERVLARPGVDARPFWRRPIAWFAVPSGVLATTVAAWLMFGRPQEAPPTPKGGTGTAAIQLACGPSGERVCRAGDTLMFSVNAAVASGHLVAYAERVADPGRGRIWYFPTAAGFSPKVTPGSGTVVLPEGIRIGPEQPPGHYRVTVWIADGPVSRTDVEAARGSSLPTRAAIELQVLP